jgi:hypothetical protein
MTPGMKYLFGLLLIWQIPLGAISQSYRHTHQIEVNQHPFDNSSLYVTSHKFEDEFDYRTNVSFTTAKPNKYVAEKVKTVELYNFKNQLFYRCELDKKGKVVKTGIQGQKYFITNKTVDLNKSHRISEIGYYKNDLLMRLDTVIFYVHTYMSGDTVFTYHERRTISYMRGQLINEKNRYLNGRYLNKKIEISDGPNLVIPSANGKKEKSKVYLKKAFKTNFDSLSILLTKDVRYFSSPFHQLGGQDLTWESVQSHAFFYLLNQQSIEFYPVEGADFNEPLQYQERMWCGSSDYDRQHYNDGRSYRYSRLENGLYDTYSLYYYPVDPNPPKKEPRPKDSTAVDEGGLSPQIEEIIDTGPRRLSTPEISAIYHYKYTFYE